MPYRRQLTPEARDRAKAYTAYLADHMIGLRNSLTAGHSEAAHVNLRRLHEGSRALMREIEKEVPELSIYHPGPE